MKLLQPIIKPTRKELIDALYHLTQWATGTDPKGEDKHGNPYGKTAVRQACALLAREHGNQDDLEWEKPEPKP